jgi:Cys-rich protein (TIGR01571 family)
MTNSNDYTVDYNILNKSEWQTNLCKCDSESCFLSCVVPCHVYAKIRARTKAEYCVHLVVYIFLYLSLQQLWYSQNYVIENTCPSTIINNCLGIAITDVDNIEYCDNYYMVIEDAHYACIEKNGFCVSKEYSCIKENDSKHLSIDLIIFTSVCYFILTCMHYSAREYIKSRQVIDESFVESIAGVICCPTCGLAQEYREL